MSSLEKELRKLRSGLSVNLSSSTSSPRKRYWIQKVKRRMERKGTVGALEEYFERKLGIPKKARIPTSILKKIKNTPKGKIIVVRYRKRRARIRVTSKLKKRVSLALTFRKFK